MSNLNNHINTSNTSRIKEEAVLIGLNKPKGVICTHKDEKNRIKIYDLIPKNIYKNIKGNLHSVGRLDFNSQGLILITNNTKIKSYLESPSSKIIRIYKVKVQGILQKHIVNKAKDGLKIGNKKFSIVTIEILKKTNNYTWLLVKLDQGKNQHIRKIFKKLGYTVNKLIRIQYGPYKLSSLETRKIKLFNLRKIKYINL
tara:strand:- start:424 stop:1020 length:597 start_codon:yes stop_codon:yes gene_type:complete